MDYVAVTSFCEYVFNYSDGISLILCGSDNIVCTAWIFVKCVILYWFWVCSSDNDISIWRQTAHTFCYRMRVYMVYESKSMENLWNQKKYYRYMIAVGTCRNVHFLLFTRNVIRIWRKMLDFRNFWYVCLRMTLIYWYKNHIHFVMKWEFTWYMSQNRLEIPETLKSAIGIWHWGFVCPKVDVLKFSYRYIVVQNLRILSRTLL